MLDFNVLSTRIPRGIASFASIRADDMIYVDKTDAVFYIANTRDPKLLTRPRRFGKSTLMSAVKELFEHGIEPYDGHDSYFKGLKIEKLWKDKGHYHVMHLDFSQLNFLCETPQDFADNLSKKFDDYAAAWGISLSGSNATFVKKLDRIIQNLPNNSLVLLIDEHDVPLTQHLKNEHYREQILNILRAIYGTIKTNSGKFRCVFVTGITRFQDLDLGTAGNTITDVSLDADLSSACGYTREELKEYFHDNLVFAAAVRNRIEDTQVTPVHIEALLDEMSAWYDGFCFDDCLTSKVFSTWSVLNFFRDKKADFIPYWYLQEGTGIPKLIKTLIDNLDINEEIHNFSEGIFSLTYKEFTGGSIVSEKYNLKSILFQTGYLTLCSSIRETWEVKLNCPNLEIKQAFGNLIAAKLYSDENRFDRAFGLRIENLLLALDPETIKEYFNELFAAITYHDFALDKESAVAYIIAANLIGAGIDIRTEVAESRGRADAIIHFKKQKTTLVFEYKYETSDDPAAIDAKLNEAIEQIKIRDYGHSVSSQEKLVRFALVFCAAPKERRLVRCVKVDELQLLSKP